jgi:hypothetical protein
VLIPILSGDQQIPVIGPLLLLLMLPIIGVLAVTLPAYLLFLSFKQLYKILKNEHNKHQKIKAQRLHLATLRKSHRREQMRSNYDNV